MNPETPKTNAFRDDSLRTILQLGKLIDSHGELEIEVFRLRREIRMMKDKCPACGHSVYKGEGEA